MISRRSARLRQTPTSPTSCRERAFSASARPRRRTGTAGLSTSHSCARTRNRRVSPRCRTGSSRILAVDDRVALALEGRDQQARRRLHRQRLLPGCSICTKKVMVLNTGFASGGIDIFDHQSVMSIAIIVAVAIKQLAHHLPAIDEHRRGQSRPALLLAGKARQQAAIAVDTLRIIGRKARAFAASWRPACRSPSSL